MPGSTSCELNGLTRNLGEDKVPSRLVLCLDGTGNLYSGNTSDTNIVK